ncbi:OSBPL1A isoform 11 [Pongo abelii]|uniref:OSBPL1A isoform 11 n=1 Tax=Pongo abelii TaxID=9601 RepID=A0A2J8XGK8_PONAB|nr:OSBPL1A isoform 11 [Pongo abelii]
MIKECDMAKDCLYDMPFVMMKCFHHFFRKLKLSQKLLEKLV